VARVFQGGKVTIPKRVWELLDVDDGDLPLIQHHFSASLRVHHLSRAKNLEKKGSNCSMVFGIVSASNEQSCHCKGNNPCRNDHQSS